LQNVVALTLTAGTDLSPRTRAFANGRTATASRSPAPVASHSSGGSGRRTRLRTCCENTCWPSET